MLAFLEILWYNVAKMYIERIKRRYKGKVHVQILLRESYRDKGAGRSHVKHRNVANLTHLPEELVRAMELALRDPRGVLQASAAEAPGGCVDLAEGLSVGGVWVVYEIARRLGIVGALGRGREAQLALWQVVARVLAQGSRLSAVRLHEVYALADVLGVREGFTEEALYENLAWLSQHQASIEDRLFRARRGECAPKLFLYDVTSSYLEGDQNAFGAYGYNRDGKKNKKQIVVGLLEDEAGVPVSVEVFAGNTRDVKTFASQVRKAARRFGCSEVTFVGDRGMIKRGQMKDLAAAGFHYITALTKPQIEALLKTGALQMELFDESVCEVECDGRRLVLRRNPVRAAELAATREDKRAAVQRCVDERNTYLAEHPRAQAAVALKHVQAKIKQLKIDKSDLHPIGDCVPRCKLLFFNMFPLFVELFVRVHTGRALG